MTTSYHGKGKRRRPGVHKAATSPETIAWNREHLIPRRPSWMDVETYCKLAKLRTELEQS